MLFLVEVQLSFDPMIELILAITFLRTGQDKDYVW